MSKKRDQRKKAQRIQSGQMDGLAKSIINCWRCAQIHEDRLGALRDAERIDEDTEACRIVRDKMIDEQIRFDHLISRGWATGQFRKLLASIEYQCEHKNALTPHEHTYFHMQEAMANASNTVVSRANTIDGVEIAVRPVLFGLPVSGALEDVKHLTSADFVKLIRAAGWVPERANVACFGLVSANDAMELSQNPMICWQLAREVLKHQAGHNSIHVPGLIPLDAPSDPNKTRAGGYVVLMGAFCVGEDAVVADGDIDGAIEAKWNEVVEAFRTDMSTKGVHIGTVGTPGELPDAAREASAQQLTLALMLQRATNDKDADIPKLSQAAFIAMEEEDAIHLVGLFDDGSEVMLVNALPTHGIWLLPEICFHMRLDEPTSILLDDETPPWRKDTYTSSGPDEPRGVRELQKPSRKLH